MSEEGSARPGTPLRGFRERKLRAEGVLAGVTAMLGKGDIAVDLGANVGAVTEQLASTGASVFAFEPDPVAFAALARRVADRPNVESINAAVGLAEGHVTLLRSVRFEDDPVAATVSSTVLSGKRDRDAAGTNDVEVRQVDLVAFLKGLIAGHGRIAFLKMDIEGGELDLLPALSAAGLLDVIGYTVVETHQRKFPEKRKDFMRMRRQMSKLHSPLQLNLDWI